jgi:hypothetical protein
MTLAPEFLWWPPLNVNVQIQQLSLDPVSTSIISSSIELERLTKISRQLRGGHELARKDQESKTTATELVSWTRVRLQSTVRALRRLGPSRLTLLSL